MVNITHGQYIKSFVKFNKSGGPSIVDIKTKDALKNDKAAADAITLILEELGYTAI